ncbi:hyoscyamine 6-dioxygenase-like [Solanum tuberosum]|uniref:1-aminocyclopropane-1-carboxylate oxidase n=1 Tax=Solanum tuberosum TaxID=4113 RepID=M1BS17_SOLTU|nr:PREDICTED: hyoscyamine 6-dioxygenase-like [Solanum tuberosum]
MENNLVSSWCKNVKTLPESYIFPEDQRPGEPIVPLSGSSPIIDLTIHEHDQAQQIIKASQDFGYFQVINHGISETLLEETVDVLKEFFNMPAKEKAKYYSVDPNSKCKLYTSTINYSNEDKHYWRDALAHHCHPLQHYLPFWPEKPTRYREVISAYSIETRKLITKISDVISEGLGLEKGYFGGELSKVQMLLVNYYPPCPDPNLALGMHSHCDPNLFTILLQDNVHGLQIFKDGKWIAVEPIPNAFVVIIGCQLQIISNNKLKSVIHRAVTNSKETRICVGNFVIPSSDCHIEPASDLVKNTTNIPAYKPYQYKEFLHTYAINHGDFEAVLQSYKL